MTADTNPAIDDELNTTAPQDKPAPWKMPEPVFRRTSGRLPKGYAEESASVFASRESSESSQDSVRAYEEPKPKSGALKLVVVVLGIAAMIAFIAVFLTFLYFFFLRGEAATP